MVLYGAAETLQGAPYKFSMMMMMMMMMGSLATLGAVCASLAGLLW